MTGKYKDILSSLNNQSKIQKIKELGDFFKKEAEFEQEDMEKSNPAEEAKINYEKQIRLLKWENQQLKGIIDKLETKIQMTREIVETLLK